MGLKYRNVYIEGRTAFPQKSQGSKGKISLVSRSLFYVTTLSSYPTVATQDSLSNPFFKKK